MTEALVKQEENFVQTIVSNVRNLPVISEENGKFLAEHAGHLKQVMEKSYMWRTESQKRSIVCDLYHPTAHAKFHQAMLEQKVQFDQAMYLAKEYELKKIELEELELDLEEAKLDCTARGPLKQRKLQIEIQFKQYELKQMHTAMHYRMEEVKGWQVIEEELLAEMREGGVSEEDIWNKSSGEIAATFFRSLSNLKGLKQSTDSAEVNNLLAVASHAVRQAKEAGKFEELKSKCDLLQLEGIHLLERAKLA